MRVNKDQGRDVQESKAEHFGAGRSEFTMQEPPLTEDTPSSFSALVRFLVIHAHTGVTVSVHYDM